MIGIIGAMEIEISGLREQMEDRQTEHISGVRFDWGTIHGVLCAVAVCGPGKVTRRCALRLWSCASIPGSSSIPA